MILNLSLDEKQIIANSLQVYLTHLTFEYVNVPKQKLDEIRKLMEDIRKEIEEGKKPYKDPFDFDEEIVPETQTHRKANREAWNPSNYDPKNNDREMISE